MSIKQYSKDLWQIIKKTSAAWYKADPFRQSSIIAYYAIFSIPPLLVIVIACTGFVFGREAVQGQISSQISNIIGPDSANQIEDMIIHTSERKTSVLATVISVITLVLGATGVFTQLQISLDQIWEVRVIAKKPLLKSLKDRLFSFGLVISIGFLALVSLLISTLLTLLSGWIKTHFPEFILYLFTTVNFVVSLAVISVLFALMFKILPDVRIQWRNVWIGALATAMLFTIGKSALGFYFGKAEPASAYGAAGSVILILLWVSYSCMIVFYGVEFTKQYAVHFGYKIQPTKDAERIHATEEQILVAEKKKVVKQQRS